MLTRHWRLLLVAAAMASYALASHWLMLHAAGQAWAVAALCGPLLLVVLATAWQRRDATSLAAGGLLLLVLGWVMWRGGVADTNRLYVLQHAGIHGALAFVFGSTLRPGATALISTLAKRVHGTLSPAMQAYTRWLTGVWVIYFVGMALMSLALYAWAPWSWWSLFGNVLTPLSLVLMFVVEHALRYRLHPEFERVSIALAVAAYRGAGGAGRALAPATAAPRVDAAAPWVDKAAPWVDKAAP